jgi:hypothetical protein
MNIVKPHVSLNVTSATMHDDPAKTAAARCTPASLGTEKPVQIRKGSGCC